jgi:DNA-binding NarL/FixJ family response regulator
MLAGRKRGRVVVSAREPAGAGGKARVIVVDDDPRFVAALRRRLAVVPYLEVVGDASDGAAGLRLARDVRPDVVLLDVAMPGMDGVETARRLRAEVPAARVVALTGHSDEHLVWGMFEAGAVGYVPKAYALEDLVPAITAALEGECFISPRLGGALCRWMAREHVADDAAPPGAPTGAPPPGAPLSPRETEVLRLLARGRSHKEIATILGIGTRTVETHREHLARKLGAASLADLVRYAVAHGLAPRG